MADHRSTTGRGPGPQPHRVTGDGLGRGRDLAQMATMELTESILQVGTWSFDLNTQTVWWSPELYRICGRDPASFTPTPETAVSVMHPDDQQAAQTFVAAVFAGEEPSPLELRVLRPDGEIRLTEVRGRFVGNDRCVGMFQDITERRQAEQERTALLAQALEIDAANRAKTEFLSRMSHELRTPLNAVLGFAQLLSLSNLAAEDRGAVDHIMRGGRHLLALIDDVLDITGVEAGTVTFTSQPFDLDVLVDEAVQLVQPMAASHSITITTSAPEPGHVAQGDPRRTTQILLNLLSNAIKYNRPGGHVTIVTKHGPDGLQVIVTDSGLGIAEDALPRVFAPFDRLGAEQSEVEGSGIGLPLARALAERMDGTLTVTSQVGVGSVFTLTLPAAMPAGGDQFVGSGSHQAAGDSSPTVPVPAAGQEVTVVNIEDNPVNRQLVEAALRRRSNIHLVNAATGAEGLALIAEHQPDLVLLDLHLPDMAGVDLLSQLVTHPDRPTIAVLSADASVERIATATTLGADHYLTKPLDIQMLLDVVDHAVAASPTARQRHP